ncbi:hypothetical protein HispidOSU_025701, partial [Sigmodon hispidus]
VSYFLILLYDPYVSCGGLLIFGHDMKPHRPLTVGSLIPTLECGSGHMEISAEVGLYSGTHHEETFSISGSGGHSVVDFNTRFCISNNHETPQQQRVLGSLCCSFLLPGKPQLSTHAISCQYFGSRSF